jgi:hypothetical protein
MNMKQPMVATLTPEEQAILIDHINAGSLSSDDKQVMIELLKIYNDLRGRLDSSKISIHKLREMLFGFKADQLKKLLQIQ